MFKQTYKLYCHKMKIAILITFFICFKDVNSLSCTKSAGIEYVACGGGASSLSRSGGGGGGGGGGGFGGGGGSSIGRQLALQDNSTILPCVNQQFTGGKLQSYVVAENQGVPSEYELQFTRINITADDKLAIKVILCEAEKQCKIAMIDSQATAPLTVPMSNHQFKLFSASAGVSVSFHVKNNCPPVNGCCSSWEDWTTYVYDCKRIRIRSCTPPENGGEECPGPDSETAPCPDGPYVIAGNWSEWGPWSACASNCSKSRTRVCSQDGKCVGESSETQPCTGGLCVVDGSWSEWGPYSTCAADCTKTRTRVCTPPENGGAECAGVSEEAVPCTGGLCVVDGSWSDWGTWSECGAACNKTRLRVCTPPENGGAPCEGPSEQFMNCSGGLCDRRGG